MARGEFQEASISFSGSGDNEIIPAVSGKRILVHKIWLVVGGITNLIPKNGAAALSGAVPMLANGSWVLDHDGTPWFTCDLATAFNLNSSAAVQVSGRVYWKHDP